MVILSGGPNVESDGRRCGVLVLESFESLWYLGQGLALLASDRQGIAGDDLGRGVLALEYFEELPCLGQVLDFLAGAGQVVVGRGWWLDVALVLECFEELPCLGQVLDFLVDGVVLRLR